MERYDYHYAVREDVREYIESHIDLSEWIDTRDELQNQLYDDLWVYDPVTGNASGSYTFNTYRAEEYICHNLDLLAEALCEFECGADYILTNGAEACDVTIRCYLLYGAIHDVLENMFDEMEV